MLLTRDAASGVATVRCLPIFNPKPNPPKNLNPETQIPKTKTYTLNPKPRSLNSKP